MSLPSSLAMLLAIVALTWSPLSFAQQPNESLPQIPTGLFQFAGAMFKIDPRLLQAIAKIESAGRADAVSPRGAAGLMQLMPGTARRFGVHNPFDPVDNVLGAARFLANLRESVAIGDLPQLLAAYNAGEAAIRRYGSIPPYPETHEYVRRVLWAYLLSDPGTNPRQDSEVESPPMSSTAAPHRAAERGKPMTDLEVLKTLTELKRERHRVERAIAPGR